MSICLKCRKRKGKRPCPALGGSLCNLCCGLLREKEIHCPPSCRFLSRHRPYQEKRILEKKAGRVPAFPGSAEDILRDPRMAWLAFHIEAALAAFAEARPSWTDKDAVLPIEYAKDKVGQGRSLLVVPGEERKPKDDAGEAVFRNVENCRHERKIVISPVPEFYKKEEKLACLERVAQSIRSAPGGIEGRAFVQGLVDRFRKAGNKAGGDNKIITLR